MNFLGQILIGVISGLLQYFLRPKQIAQPSGDEVLAQVAASQAKVGKHVAEIQASTVSVDDAIDGLRGRARKRGKNRGDA
jgi:hypothetical protein